MVLRIEKHFKAEQAARKTAEELLQKSIAAEFESKNKLEDVLKKRQQEQKLLEEERNAIKRVSLRACMLQHILAKPHCIYRALHACCRSMQPRAKLQCTHSTPAAER